jgi:hypothetical protein
MEPMVPHGAGEGNSPSPARFLDANRIGLVLLVLLTIPLLTKIFTSDYGTHLALGRHIVQTRSLPTPERWNYPSLGMENGSGGEWGFEALLWVVHSAGDSLQEALVGAPDRGAVFSTGGDYAVSLMLWLCTLGIVWFLYRSAVIRGAHPVVAVLAIYSFAGFLRIRIQPRPEIFTYLFITLTIWILTEYYFGTRKRLVWAFPALLPLWANMHPSYLMAFLLSGVYFADAFVRAAMRGELQWPRLKGWAFAPVAATLLALVTFGLNPHGYSWLLAPLRMIFRSGVSGGGGEANVLQSISELTPVAQTGFYVHYKAAAAFVAVTSVLGLLGRRLHLLDLLLFAAAFKGAWSSARAVSMMGLLLSTGAAVQVSAFLSMVGDRFRKAVPASRDRDAARKGKGKDGKGGAPAEPLPPPVAVPYLSRFPAAQKGAAAVVCGAMLVFGTVTVSFSLSQLEWGVGVTEHKFSFAAADFLRKNPPKGNMINFFDIGGFLDWQLYPQALTYIDGRTYNHDIFMEHQVITSAMPGWEEAVRRHQATYFVLKGLDSSGMILPIIPALSERPEWHLVFSDGIFVVFVREGTGNDELIRRFEIPKSALPQHIIRESWHYLALGVSPVVAYSNMANMYLARGDRKGAIDALRQGIAVEDHPMLRARLQQLEGGGPARGSMGGHP